MLKQKKYTKRQLQEIEDDLRTVKRAIAIFKDKERMTHVNRLRVMQQQAELI